MTQLTIHQLSIFPVKSLGEIKLQKMELVERGPKYDRHWMVVNEDGRFLTQRQFPKMCLISVSIRGGTLSLRAPNGDQLTVNDAKHPMREVQVWKDTVSAQDCGDEAAEWLSKQLGKRCRLVSMPNSTERLVDPLYASSRNTLGFADGFPLLVISQASLNQFNQRLSESGFVDQVEMNRFRPNIVISGNSEPHAEDNWKAIRVNGITLSLVKLCSRCIVPSINPATAQKQSKVIQELNTYRRQGKKINFGQNAIHDQTGIIKVGDAVELIR